RDRRCSSAPRAAPHQERCARRMSRTTEERSDERWQWWRGPNRNRAARAQARRARVGNRCASALREVLQESWIPYPQFWKVLKILRLLQERARLARWSGGVPPPRERDALAPAGEDARGPWALLQARLFQDRQERRVIAQRLHRWIDLQPDDRFRAVCEALFQIADRGGVVAE